MAGVYVHHWGTHSTVGAPGVALFMNRGDIHRTAHPAGCGDRSIELVLSDEFAEPFTRAPADAFPRRVVRVHAVLDLEIRLLARAATRGDLTALELDERVHGVIERILGMPPVGSLAAGPRATVEAALEYLAWHVAEDADLLTVAAAVGSSPHHLSRLFHAGIGTTLSGFRSELRVRAALERIVDGAPDLSSVACDVGFFDHAHMTRTFRRVLGRIPSELRPDPGRALEERSLDDDATDRRAWRRS